MVRTALASMPLMQLDVRTALASIPLMQLATLATGIIYDEKVHNYNYSYTAVHFLAGSEVVHALSSRQ